MPPEQPQAYRRSARLQVRTSYQSSRALDNVPMRTRTLTREPQDGGAASSADSSHAPQASLSQLKRVLYPELPLHPPSAPPSPLPSPADEHSYSPTLSEIDALDQTFLDYELQSDGILDNARALPVVPAPGASSANYLQDDSDSTTSSSYVSVPDTADETLVNAPRSRSLQERLHCAWPQCPPGLEDAPFIVRWEVTRVAVHCDVQFSHRPFLWEEGWRDQNVFWNALKSHRGFKGRKLPPPTDPRAWNAAMGRGLDGGNHVAIFTATMHAIDSTTGLSIRLELDPPKCEQSSRLFRRFGSDRFLEVRIPSLDSWQRNDETTEEILARWLTAGRHTFMNRQWAAFYVRDRPIKSQPAEGPQNKREAKAVFYDRVLFFAEADATSMPSPMPVISRTEMLDWLLALKNQNEQPYLKLFHRIALGLTNTIPAMVLEQDQIWDRSEDVISPTTGQVMNDGAGRISPSLMRKVRDVLGLQTIPSAIQGRLGSAKGMWLVHVQDQSNEDWIETYPTQRKWNCDMSDEAHRTLEVMSWSSELSPASLNIQFLPILEDRAKSAVQMRDTFVRNMTTESEEELQALKLALQHTELFRKWIREGSQPSFQRLTSRSMPFIGGLPESYEDIMSFLVDGGFEPMHLKFLQKIVFQKQKTKGDAMKKELKIKMAKSTYAYMLVDFWGVLEENQVHLSFSSKFNDGTDELSDLDDRDILVGRCPAHLPSDIQRVKAVFKPELRHLRDVVIFSAKGDMPLAAKLSGGDYDGDKAWICWDPDVVQNFKNHRLPPKPDFSSYLSKDTLQLGHIRDMYGEDGYIDAMLEKAFRFNLKPKLLGSCTSYKEKFAYHRGRVSDKVTIKLSWLLSELADQPKQGILFDHHTWSRFRDDVVGKRLMLSAPAYKDGGGAGLLPNAKHVIDYLMYTTKQVVDRSLTDLHQFQEASGASSRDEDVVGYWDHFEKTFGDHSRYGRPRCAWFLALRDGLQTDTDACVAEWRDTFRQGVEGYPDKVRHMYAKWRAITPRFPADASRPASPLPDYARKFLLEADPVALDLTKWELLKASFAFKQYHTSRFVWQMAGRQLQAIKALAVRSQDTATHDRPFAAPVVVVSNMYVALRPDNTYIKRIMAFEGDGDEAIEYEDQMGRREGLDGLLWPSSQEGSQIDC